MLDKIAKAYKSMVEPIKKPVKNDYPILMDGKTFPEEKSARQDDPPEQSLEDVIKSLKESFNVPPKEGLDQTLEDLTKGSYGLSDAGYHIPDHIKHLNSVFKDIVKNGVNYEKLDALSDVIHTAKLPWDHKNSLGDVWSKTIQKHFGKDEDDIGLAKQEPKTKEEMLAHVAKHPTVRMSSLNKGYCMGRTGPDRDTSIRVPVGIDKHGEAHVLSEMLTSGQLAAYANNHETEEANHLEEMHKNYFKEISNEAPKHDGENVNQRIDKVRTLVRYTADHSVALHQYLIFKHNQNHDAVNGVMKKYDHKIMPTHEEYGDKVNNISDVVNNAPAIEKPISVFSGLSGKSGIHAHAEKHKQTSGDNMVFHLPAFTSTSTKFSISAAFSKDAPIHPDEEKMYTDHTSRKDVQDILHVKLPKGFKRGAYVEHVSENGGEHEYLLDRGLNVSVHPEPKYIFKSNSLYRIWDAHPHKEEE